MLVALLLAFALAWIGASGASPTADEPTYIGQGRYIAGSGDARAPVLLWQPPAALLLTSATLGAADVPTSAFESRPAADSLTDLGDRLLWESGVEADEVLFWSRLPVWVVFGLLAAWAAFVAGRLGGRRAAWIAGLLVALSPPLMAHGGLATTDAPATLACLLAVGGSALVFDRDGVPGWREAGLVGLALGLALATKHTNVLLVPLLVIAFVVVPWARGRRGWTLLRAPAALVAAATLVVWASYGFHTAPLVGADSTGDLATKLADRVPLPREWTLTLAQDVPVPAPRYLQSIVFQASKQHGRLYFRYFDELAKVGWWSFFPVVTLGKLTLGAVVALVAAAFARRSSSEGDERRAPMRLLLTAFLLLFGAAVLSRHNLGVRHVLPALAPLLVWAAVRLAHIERPWLRRVVLGALLLHTAEGLHAARAPISWWNLASGGATNGWRVSGGADADWGQGVFELVERAEDEGWTPLHIEYRGPESSLRLLRAAGVHPTKSLWRTELPESGWLAVSNTAYWPERDERFQGIEPVAWVADCYRIYRLPLR